MQYETKQGIICTAIIGAGLSFCTLLIGMAVGHPSAPATKAPPPRPDFTLRGTVNDISWRDLHDTAQMVSCTEVFFTKDTGDTIRLYTAGWPPTWKGAHAELDIYPDGTCGYNIVSSKELK